MHRIRITCGKPFILSLMPFDCRELAALLGNMLRQYFDENDTAVLPNMELAIVDDAHMEQLNRQSLGLLGPTNILSFPAEDTTEFLGWAALAPETARRESLLYGQDEKEYTIRLLAHGLAHLLGYDHGQDMNACTDKLEKAADNIQYC